MKWHALASYGDSEEQVRAALDEARDETVNRCRRELRAEGWASDAIEHAAAFVATLCDENNEEALPMILRDMALTFGAAASH